MDTLWDIILSCATALLAGAAIVAIIIECRRCRFDHAIDLIVELDDHFNSEEMRKYRRAAARMLIDTKDFQSNYQSDIDDVLGFFEKVGFLARNKVIDERMIWHEMYHWIHRYYLATTPYITHLRTAEKDKTIYEDFSYLHERLVAVEKKERKCEDDACKLTNEELIDFLQRELQK